MWIRIRTAPLEGDAQIAELPLDRSRPTAIRKGARGARMKDRADRYVLGNERSSRAALREGADADDDARPELSRDVAQGIVASGAQRLLFRRGKLVRRQIARARFHERERAIVHDEKTLEEPFGRPESI